MVETLIRPIREVIVKERDRIRKITMVLLQMHVVSVVWDQLNILRADSNHCMQRWTHKKADSDSVVVSRVNRKVDIPPLIQSG